MKLLVCGSRSWTDYKAILTRFEELKINASDSVVIHGGAAGADTLAGLAARSRWVPVEVFPADWKTHGRVAGFIRNIAMLDTKPDLVLAFWDGKSPGTKHTINEALKRHIRTEVIFPRPA